MNAQKIESDDVVITGIAGRFPKSRNIQEFASNLFNKVDMIDDSDERFINVLDDVPHRFGKIPDLDKFDASFFSMLKQLAKYTDPQMRILLEHSYEAILDAGISPQSLIGSNTGVFIGCSSSETKNFYTKSVIPIPKDISIHGNGIFYLANRISYTFGLHGPSLVLDSACSSASYALDCAYQYLKSGKCHAALVAGTNLISTPHVTEQFVGMKLLASDGISKIFDEDSKGFVRAETISVIFLQKRKDAKRIYAHLIYSLSNNDGFKIEGSSLPSKEMQQKLIKKFYQDINFDPHEIKFFEAHATGTFKGDIQEVNAIDAILCQNRSDQLVIGSVKSNIGHAEPASGSASIAKILNALENGKFPPNINLFNLREDIPAFKENRILVATDSVALGSPYIAMNSFALGGSNVHLLFKQNTKEKLNQVQDYEIERMVLWSGRTEEAIHAIFDDITSRPLDIEHIALLQNSQNLTPDANSYRSYGIFKNDQEKATCIDRNIQYFDGIRKAIVFIFGGMGTQWHGMGRELIKIPLFAESIEITHEILLKKGINLKEILYAIDENIFDRILETALCFIAIQIGLTDILNTLNIKPDFIVGHSAGEIVYSYYDGCLTREEALTLTYYRAKTMSNLVIIEGAMAAVGMHYSEIEKILPKDIDIACHNCQQSSTISGPKKVKSLVLEFHFSRYMTEAAKEYEKKLLEILKNPKVRSSKWFTTNYIEDNEENKFCNAKYYADNVKNPVHFEEATSKLPKNSITIEISPNGIFQSFLKSTLSESIYVTLTDKNENDGRSFFMKSLGKIFQSGVDFDISKLYPAVDFPVSRGTPMISPIIKWNHQENHFVPKCDNSLEYQREAIILNFKDKDLEYLTHHIIDERVLVPAAFWVFYIWKQFAKMNDSDFDKLKVVFKDLEFFRVTINLKQEIEVVSTIQRSNGRFEIMEGKNLIASDSIAQTGILSTKVEKILLPLKLKKLSIDPVFHKLSIDEQSLTYFERDKYDLNYMKCGGIEIEELQTFSINRCQHKHLLKEYSKFISFENCKEKFEIFDALKIMICILIDLEMKYKYNFIEINYQQEDFIYKQIHKLFKIFPIAADIKLLTITIELDDIEVLIYEQDVVNFNNIDVIFTHNCSKDNKFVNVIGKFLNTNNTLISKENFNTEIPNNLEILSKLQLTSENVLLMLKLKLSKKELKVKPIEITSESIDWLEDLKEEIKNFSNNDFDSIVLYSQKSKGISGLLGFFNCLKLEFNKIRIKCVIIEDINAPEFDIDSSFYKNQIEKGFDINVLKKMNGAVFDILN
ncbi:hypothetical protein PVAND_004202 [Polypedilum vanderplanki]|uniref:Ketosynthase family 3 (KS3) domain-containing protein n=1 Tax=Polypedilum vanderplanki TaxID=319348 RepID=A0A9J6BYD9_POLVA|nr:hypothetical protein PVAND_004202 [Polypedilum vanderplanki]